MRLPRRPLPRRLLPPRRVYDGVRLGVEHGGNKSGVPTVNGSLTFHERFLGKPLVFCGTGGLLPAIGIALNMRFIFRGSAIPFYFVGYVFAMLIGGKFFPGVTAPAIGTIVVTTAIVGAAAAWIFVSISGSRSSEREA